MLLALSTAAISGGSDEIREDEHHSGGGGGVGGGGRKRSRTRFSQEQKQRMRQFAEKFGWRMPREEEKLVEEFCGEIGISRRVLKVWMHNNKQGLGKRDVIGGLRLHVSPSSSSY